MKHVSCPNCGHEVAPVFVDITSGATKCGANAARPEARDDFLIRTYTGNLIRIRVRYTRQDDEFSYFKLSAAPVIDETGDVVKDQRGANVIFPAFSYAVRTAALAMDPVSGKPLLSFQGDLADQVATHVMHAEARMAARLSIESMFGAPRGEESTNGA